MSEKEELEAAYAAKKNLSTRQQYLLQKDWIRHAAKTIADKWHLNPKPILELFEARGIEPERDLILFDDASLECCENWWSGLVVTRTKDFIRVELTLSHDGTRIEDLESWQIVNDKYPISDRAPGVQKTYGQLCVELLEEINGV